MFLNSCRKHFGRVERGGQEKAFWGVRGRKAKDQGGFEGVSQGHRKRQYQNPGQQKANLAYFKVLPWARHECEKVCT